MSGLKIAVSAVLFVVSFTLLIPSTLAQDVEGSKDHPLFTRLPNN